MNLTRKDVPRNSWRRILLTMRVQVRRHESGVYAGSFDPLTVGHLWMIEQSVGLFDGLTVAVGVNPEEKHTFPLEERLAMLRDHT